MEQFNNLKSKDLPFNFENVDDFDHHIDLSIPHYSFVVDQVKKYSMYFVQPWTNVYDLGCSTGKMIIEMDKKPNAIYNGIDISDNLLPKENPTEWIQFHQKDLTTFHYDRTSFAWSLFTLQFMSLQQRREVLEKIGKSMIPGSAFISCEKIYADNSRLQDINNSMYYEFKNKSFSGDEILKKDRDLRQIMQIQTLKESIADLEEYIGPTEVFWRSYNFAGILAIKR